MNTNTPVILCLAFGCFLAITFCQAQIVAGDAPDSTRSERPIMNSADAVQRASDIFGSPESRTMTVATLTDNVMSAETYFDSSAPQALMSLNNRIIYRVTTQVQFDTTKDDGCVRDFDVLVDSATGQLVRIESTLPSYHRKIVSGALSSRPVQELAEENTIRKCLVGEHASLPSKGPSIGFLQVWKTALGGSLHPKADRVLAWFVTLNVPFRGVENVWYIETWPSITPISAGMPVNGGTSLTGKTEARGDQPLGCERALVSEDGEWGIMTP